MWKPTNHHQPPKLEKYFSYISCKYPKKWIYKSAMETSGSSNSWNNFLGKYKTALPDSKVKGEGSSLQKKNVPEATQYQEQFSSHPLRHVRDKTTYSSQLAVALIVKILIPASVLLLVSTKPDSLNKCWLLSLHMDTSNRVNGFIQVGASNKYWTQYLIMRKIPGNLLYLSKEKNDKLRSREWTTRNDED